MDERREAAEIEREKRLASAIVDALSVKLKECDIPRKKHDDDHEFIAKLRVDDEQRKKWRAAIIEKVVTTVAGSVIVSVLAFLVMVLWGAFKAGLKA